MYVKNEKRSKRYGASLFIDHRRLASLAVFEGYQLQRILGFLHPEKYADGAGYLYLRLKELLSTAGWFGASGKSEFIPAAHTDLVFAGLTYYYGYSFALILVLVLVFFAARMFVISQPSQRAF